MFQLLAAFAAYAFLVAMYAAQCGLYRMLFPHNNRYDFPAMLLIPLTACILIAEIAQSANDQSTSLNEVNSAVNQMDQVTQQNAAMVEEVTAAATSLKGEGVELERLVARFNTGASAAAAPTRARPQVAQAGRHAPARSPARAAQAKLAAAADEWEEF